MELAPSKWGSKGGQYKRRTYIKIREESNLFSDLLLKSENEKVFLLILRYKQPKTLYKIWYFYNKIENLTNTENDDKITLQLLLDMLLDIYVISDVKMCEEV